MLEASLAQTRPIDNAHLPGQIDQSLGKPPMSTQQAVAAFRLLCRNLSRFGRMPARLKLSRQRSSVSVTCCKLT